MIRNANAEKSSAPGGELSTKASGSKTPLSKVKNFGPVTLAEFESMGMIFLEQVQELGFEEMCRRYVQYYPERLNANAFLGVICSIEATLWTKATTRQRQMAHAMVATLRAELGLPMRTRRKPSTRKRTDL